MKGKVCILDYGSGNVTSVFNMVSRIAETKITNNPSDIRDASHLILPGVGSFGASMEKIKTKLPIDIVLEEVQKGKPFLGICVGMQVLAENGFEFGRHAGLRLIPGSVKQLDGEGLRLPHIGWNNLEIKHPHRLLENISNLDDFYFVHSFAFSEIPQEYILAETVYGVSFPSVLAKGNLMGVQFHPEKSQSRGVQLIQNFLAFS